MITKDLQVVNIEGSLSGEKIAMGIHADAVAHIMYQLANLYSDPVLAFIRETSTNADDARIAAGSSRATEVTLPSRLAPMFIVRDYGIGMSYDDIVAIYSQYGASTKRESNDFNGALGFGCKAPLAYTPQFSVTSVQHGEQVTITVSREADGGGSMQVQREPTTAPNGTMVMVPVKSDDVDRCRETAEDFYRYWKPGTVLVNGAQPKHLDATLKLTDKLAIVKDGKDDRIVMANVAYPIPYEARLALGLGHGYSLVAEVETGSVEFTPSREALKVTQDTRKRLDQVRADFMAAVQGAIQDKVTAAPDKPAALKAMVEWTARLPKEARSADGKYTFQGLTLPAEWRQPKQPGMDWPFLVAPVYSHIESRHDGVDHIGAQRFSQDVFVTGWTSAKLSTSQKRRMLMWLSDHEDKLGIGRYDRDAQFICVREENLPAEIKPWVNPNKVVSWKHIKDNYKLPTTTGGASLGYGSWKQVAGSYEDVWTESGKVSGETAAKDIRQDKPIYFLQTKEGHLSSGVHLLKSVHTEFTVVKLQANRVAKFQRDFPAAKRLRAGLEASYANWRKTVTNDHLRAMAAQNGGGYVYGRPPLKELDHSLVDDPALAEAIKLSKMDLTSIQQSDRFYRNLLGKSLQVPNFKNPLDSYPLATNIHRLSGKALDHLYLYLNAAYAA